MENTEQNQPTQPAAEAPAPKEVSQPLTSELKPKKPFLLPILLSLVMFVLGGGIVFAYLRFLKPEKVVSQPVVSPSPSPVSSPAPSPSPSPEVTAGWETYDSQCGFTLKYPADWETADPPICGTLKAPNFTKRDVPENYGLFLRFSRREKGSKTSVFKEGVYTPIILNTLDDYIESRKNDGAVISDVRDKAYDSLIGRYFLLYSEAEAVGYANFIFVKDDFIYIIDYPTKYVDNYADDIENIILSLTF